MPLPTSEEVFTYAPVSQPVVSNDPAQAMPIGVGPAATGGDTIDINVKIGPFAGPVNVSFMIYAPALESDELYFMSSQGRLRKLSKAVEEYEQRNLSAQDSDSDDHGDGYGSHSASNFSDLVRWKDNVTGVNADIYSASVDNLPSGVYTLVLVVKPRSGGDDNYYRWITHVTIP